MRGTVIKRRVTLSRQAIKSLMCSGKLAGVGSVRPHISMTQKPGATWQHPEELEQRQEEGRG